MKKMIIIIGFLLLFNGCAILNPKTMKPVYPPPIKKTASNYDLTLLADNSRFVLKINNRSAKSINIVWDDSAIVENGVSHSLVPTGTKYIKANETKTDLIVPAGLEVTAVFSSANSVYYNEAIRGWEEDDISAGSYVISIAVKNGDRQENTDFSFNVTEKLIDESELYEDVVE